MSIMWWTRSSTNLIALTTLLMRWPGNVLEIAGLEDADDLIQDLAGDLLVACR